MYLLWVRFHLVIKNWAFYHEGLSKCQPPLSVIFAEFSYDNNIGFFLYKLCIVLYIYMQVVLLLARLYTMLSHFRYPFT